MNAFNKIIGYDAIKEELMQICDMIHNAEIYESLGAKLPHGIMLYGDPGLGKTLMAKCFIEQSGLKAYTVRKNKGSDDFIDEITGTFKIAKENAPSVVLLDDIDKFANEDTHHRDAEEYVAVQAGIDDIKGSGVFVLATANDIRKLPGSLVRSGRFDRKLEIKGPNEDDAFRIIKHYLSDKKVSDEINMEDLTKMINYSSCAALETILNEAAIRAARARKEYIEMNDLLGAVLRMEYSSPDDFSNIDMESIEKIALHEAGHLVVCEVLCPGSVGLASIRKSGKNSTGGFIHRCKNLAKASHDSLISLAGKAAVELYFSDSCAEGCQQDIRRAYTNIRDYMSELGTHGFGMIDVATHRFPETSESLNARNEAVVQAELERCLMQTRDILLKNREFLEKVKTALMEKETLVFSDIKTIRESIGVTSPEAVA